MDVKLLLMMSFEDKIHLLMMSVEHEIAALDKMTFYYASPV